jgi:hypothetical protein
MIYSTVALLFLVFVSIAEAKVIKLADVPWLSQLKKADLKSIHVCGTPRILLNKRSLKSQFFFGQQRRGYFFTEMISKKDYFDILKVESSSKAKSILGSKFGKTHLWVLSSQNELKDLGVPSKIEFPFETTIRDCTEGSKAHHGIDCSQSQGRELQQCCSEKFPGPVIYWGEKQEYQLKYSPDPSVRLSVPSEKVVWYCNVEEDVRF